MGNYYFTSESVTEGHPDKMCDAISDAILDAVIEQDPMGRVACETAITTGLVVVDTYGGYARHGGGAFSGKDCTKVDRSAAYAARYIAKNIVAAGLAEKCEIQLSYAIGVARPMSIMVDTFGTSKLSDSVLSEIICRHFDLRPTGIIKMLNLRQPIYKQTSAYGHFGRDDLDLSWEKTDKIEVLKEDYNSIISKKSK